MSFFRSSDSKSVLIYFSESLNLKIKLSETTIQLISKTTTLNKDIFEKVKTSGLYSEEILGGFKVKKTTLETSGELKTTLETSEELKTTLETSEVRTRELILKEI